MQSRTSPLLPSAVVQRHPPQAEISLENQDNRPLDDCSFAIGGGLVERSSFQSTGGVSPGSWERVDRNLPVLKAAGQAKGSPFLDPPRVSGEGARKAPQVCRRPPWIGSPHSSLARLPSLEGGGRGGGRSFAGSEIEAHPWFREGGRRNACCSCAARVLSLCCDLHARGGCFCGWILSRYFGDGIGKLGWWSMDDGGNFLFFTFSFFFGKIELFTLWIERSIYFLFVLC